MKHLKTLILITILIIPPLDSKEYKLEYAPNLKLTKDSIANFQILKSLDLFLSNINNDYEYIPNVDSSEKIETYILIDEIISLDSRVIKEDTNTFDPYITNLLPLKDSTYLASISYLGINESIPLYRATIELVLKKDKENFSISSPLSIKTNNWNYINNGNYKVIYDFNIDESEASILLTYITNYDKILGNDDIKSTYYFTTNSSNLLDIIGVQFKSDYNGITTGSLKYDLEKENLVVLGNKNYDPHDLWHSRLSLLKPRKDCFKFIDEGCAYLYGGSWGYSWNEILIEFEKQVVDKGNNDWLSLKSSPSYFMTGKFKNSADYIITALIINEVEQKYGYEGVRELINLNPENDSIDDYYSILNRLVNVNENNYNERVNQILKNH
ncbi:MAG: hypothetical protein ACE364_04845 [Chlorobiota bacterium]